MAEPEEVEAPKPEDFARAFGSGVMKVNGATLIGDGEKLFLVEDED